MASANSARSRRSSEAPFVGLAYEYGKKYSGFRRYQRWVETGVFEALLKILAELIDRDRGADIIDSTMADQPVIVTPSSYRA